MGGPYLCPDYQRARGLHFHRATNEIAVAVANVSRSSTDCSLTGINWEITPALSRLIRLIYETPLETGFHFHHGSEHLLRGSISRLPNRGTVENSIVSRDDSRFV